MSCIYNENFCRNYGTDVCDHDHQESTEPDCYKPMYGMGDDLYQEEKMWKVWGKPAIDELNRQSKVLDKLLGE